MSKATEMVIEIAAGMIECKYVIRDASVGMYGGEFVEELIVSDCYELAKQLLGDNDKFDGDDNSALLQAIKFQLLAFYCSYRVNVCRENISLVIKAS